MVSSLNHIISEIQRKENAISLSASNEIDEAYHRHSHFRTGNNHNYLLSCYPK